MIMATFDPIRSPTFFINEDGTKQEFVENAPSYTFTTTTTSASYEMPSMEHILIPIETIDGYIDQLVKDLPDLKDVRLLYDDSPDEISIRLEFDSGLSDVPEPLMVACIRKLNEFKTTYRLTGVNNVQITYTFNEVF